MTRVFQIQGISAFAESQDLRVAPLTLVFGPNSAGKSALLRMLTSFDSAANPFFSCEWFSGHCGLDPETFANDNWQGPLHLGYQDGPWRDWGARPRSAIRRAGGNARSTRLNGIDYQRLRSPKDEVYNCLGGNKAARVLGVDPLRSLEPRHATVGDALRQFEPSTQGRRGPSRGVHRVKFTSQTRLALRGVAEELHKGSKEISELLLSRSSRSNHLGLVESCERGLLGEVESIDGSAELMPQWSSEAIMGVIEDATNYWQSSPTLHSVEQRLTAIVADFLVVDAHMERASGIPLPSFNLWKRPWGELFMSRGWISAGLHLFERDRDDSPPACVDALRRLLDSSPTSSWLSVDGLRSTDVAQMRAEVDRRRRVLDRQRAREGHKCSQETPTRQSDTERGQSDISPSPGSLGLFFGGRGERLRGRGERGAASTSARQVRPIIDLLTIVSDTQVWIAQPELFLHPSNQAQLGSVIASAAQRGNTLLIETHSEHLILRLLRLVREGQLDRTDLSVAYVSPGDQGARVHQMEVSPEGQFITAWPGGFFPERLEASR